MNNPRQHTLWLLAALAAPIAHFSGVGWLTGVLTALAVLLLMLIPGSWELPRPVALLELLWLGVTAGLLLPGSAVYWPSDNTTVVPLTILALAAITRSGSAPRIGAVLALCMALLAIPLGVSAASRIELEWLRPAFGRWSPELGITLLLPVLPAAGDGQRGRLAGAAAVLTAALCTLVQGTIGAAGVPDPFYQTARTLGHMEPVAAAAVTLSWYALMCLLLQSGFTIADAGGISRKTAGGILIGTAAGLVLVPWEMNTNIVAAASLILWLIVPAVARKTFSKKDEKRC